MSDPGTPEYKIGDIVNGHVLTESGWQPVPSGQSTTGQPTGQPTAGQPATGQPATEYKIGDQAGGYVLTETGWQPVPGGQPTGQPAPEYKVGDVAGGYVLTTTGWQPLPGGQPGYPVPGAAEGAAGSPYGPMPAQPRSNKVLYWVLGGAAALVLVIVIGVVLAVRGNDDSGPVTSQPTSQPTSRPTGNASPSPTAAQTAKTFAFGDTGTVTKAGKETGELKVDAPVPFQPTNQFDTPDRGQYVYVPVTMTATGTDSVRVDTFDFFVILPDGQRVRESFIVGLPTDAPARLPSSNLNPGEKVTGSIGFDVPANTALKVAYAPTGQVLGTWG
ncbi:MAG: DUF4352 domain-containing protein [Dermatophilaceae bacterium]